MKVTSISSLIAILILSLILFSQQSTFAQSKVYAAKFQEGEDYYNVQNYTKALRYFLQADSAEGSNAEAKYKIGLCYLKTQYKLKSLSYFESVAKLAPSKFGDIQYLVGFGLQLNHEFEKALKEYNGYRDYLITQKDSKDKTRSYDDLMKRIAECKEGIDLMAHPVKVEIENMGTEINSKYVDYSPVISADEDMLMFTSRRQTTTGGTYDEYNEEYREDIYRSYKKSDKWETASNIGPPINTSENDATINLSPDGQKLLIFIDSKGEGNIWESKLNGEEWTKPEKLPAPINTKFHETSAAYSYDGNTLYFVSYRDGGMGGSDIYYVTKEKNGTWSQQAKNIGAPINTPYDEESIYMMPDGRTMYFSSKGHKTMGGFDIFKSFLDSTGKWSEPENIGYPINTADDDETYVMAASGKHAYYTSVKKDGFGTRDIYVINYIDAIKNTVATNQADKNNVAELMKIAKDSSLVIAKNVDSKTSNLTIIKGVIADAITNKPIGATITLTDNTKGGEEIANFQSNSKTGKYLVALPSGKNYGIDVKADGYLFHSENFEIPAAGGYVEMSKAIPMKDYSVGNIIIMKNVFYDSDKSTLRKESTTELNLLVKLLTEMPNMTIEISSHTDNKGGEKYNVELSEKRSESVVAFLISKGIEAKRLSSKGYGFSMPIGSNESELGRQLNRRTEFKILSK
jgi:outer membrane protein OmpA-like peptidoglycan-associated protein/tetratricopeptide (TPR) repeat protein